MSFLDKVVKGAGAASESSQSSLISAVLAFLSSPQVGGIQGLIKQFTEKGLGNVITSWVGTGTNLPITPDQIKSVFASDQLKTIAQKAGISNEAVTTGLSQVLPQIINRLTPKGEIPQGDLMSKGMELFKEKIAS